MKLNKTEAEILAEVVLWSNGQLYFSHKDSDKVRAIAHLRSMNYIHAHFDDDGDIVISATRHGRTRIFNPRKLMP